MENFNNNVKKTIVGIGNVCVAKESRDMVSYAIGSCIALCLYDSITGVGAMAHILLPARSFIGKEGGEVGISTKYADHALASALRQMCRLGADQKRIRAAIIGGARMFTHGTSNTLNIGELNIASVSQELKKRHIPLLYSIIGGEKARTVTFRIPGRSFEEQIFIRTSSV